MHRLHAQEATLPVGSSGSHSLSDPSQIAPLLGSLPHRSSPNSLTSFLQKHFVNMSPAHKCSSQGLFLEPDLGLWTCYLYFFKPQFPSPIKLGGKLSVLCRAIGRIMRDKTGHEHKKHWMSVVKLISIIMTAKVSVLGFIRTEQIQSCPLPLSTT